MMIAQVSNLNVWIVLGLITVFVIGLIIFNVKSIRSRIKRVNKKLPDLDSLSDKKEVTISTKKVDNTEQMKEAMTVSSKTKINRKDYISGDKTTTLTQDFGDLLDTPEERTAKKIKESTNSVALPKLDESNSDNKKDDIDSLNLEGLKPQIKDQSPHGGLSAGLSQKSSTEKKAGADTDDNV